MMCALSGIPKTLWLVTRVEAARAWSIGNEPWVSSFVEWSVIFSTNWYARVLPPLLYWSLEPVGGLNDGRRLELSGALLD